MKPVLVAPPAELPVTLAEAKKAARVDFADDDTSIEAYLAAAVTHLDGYSGILGRCMVTQTWKQGFRTWAPRLRLPFPDVDANSVAVTYFDADAAEQTIAPTQYEVVDGYLGAEVVFKATFAAAPFDNDREARVFVTFDAGYGAASDVPADIKVVIKALTRHWYDGESGEPAQMRMIEKYRCRPV